MRKSIIIFILFISLVLIAAAGCEKAPITDVYTLAESKKTQPETGITFIPKNGFKADQITFYLRKGQSVTNYGQTLKQYGVVSSVPEGDYIFYGAKVTKDRKDVLFRTYVIENGEQRNVSKTSLITVKNEETTIIYIQ